MNGPVTVWPPASALNRRRDAQIFRADRDSETSPQVRRRGWRGAGSSESPMAYRRLAVVATPCSRTAWTAGRGPSAHGQDRQGRHRPLEPEPWRHERKHCNDDSRRDDRRREKIVPWKPVRQALSVPPPSHHLGRRGGPRPPRGAAPRHRRIRADDRALARTRRRGCAGASASVDSDHATTRFRARKRFIPSPRFSRLEREGERGRGGERGGERGEERGG